jgi:hypothetical protein
MLDFFMSDRFFKTMEEPISTTPALPDPAAELKSEIEALKAQVESLKVPAPVDPDPVPEPTPEPEPVIPFVAEQEPATEPLKVGGQELEQFRRLAMRSDRNLGGFFKDNSDAIRSQIKQLLEV